AVRLHVEHFLYTVDLLLNREGYGFDQRFCTRTRVGRRNLNGGRSDGRILGDGEKKYRDTAKKNDDERDDVRQDRMFDEELGEHDGAARGSGFRRLIRRVVF